MNELIDLLRADLELRLTLGALLIGGMAALLGVWLARDPKRPKVWAYALTALIFFATAIGLVQGTIDHLDTEQMEEDVARILQNIAQIVQRSADPELQALLQDHLAVHAESDVLDRLKERNQLSGAETRLPEVTAQATYSQPIGHELVAALQAFSRDIRELGIDLWSALASVLVAGLAAILGIWIERDLSRPAGSAVLLTSLIVIATGVAFWQTYIEVADAEQLEDDVAGMLVAMDAIARRGENRALNAFVATEMQAQARANPAVLDKVATTAADQGQEPGALLARYLPAAELRGRPNLVSTGDTEPPPAYVLSNCGRLDVTGEAR